MLFISPHVIKTASVHSSSINIIIDVLARCLRCTKDGSNNNLEYKHKCGRKEEWTNQKVLFLSLKFHLMREKISCLVLK